MPLIRTFMNSGKRKHRIEEYLNNIRHCVQILAYKSCYDTDLVTFHTVRVVYVSVYAH